MFNKKKLRYFYWLALAFIQKNAQSIILSFLISIISIIIVISVSPFLVKRLSNKTEIIGIAGTYEIDKIPDTILSKLSNGLVHINEKGEVIPLLADSWEQLDNGKEYRFHMKKNLTWNDGKPFNAKQVNYKFTDVKVETNGDYLLIYKLKEALPTFPTFLTRPVVRSPLVGVAGWYKVEKLRVSGGEVQEIQLTPNKEGLPILIYKFYDTETKLINAYKLGEITQMTTSNKKVLDQFEDWKNTEITRSVDYSRVMALFFNMNHPLIKEEKDLRHALAMSVNTEQFAELGEEADGPIAPTSWAYNPPARAINYNPNQASRLLKKYQEGTQAATLTISTYYDYLGVADEIKQNLEAVGMTTKVEVLAGDRPTTYDLFLAQMTLSQDPDQYFFWHSSQTQITQGNITSYRNVRIDKLLEDGRKTFNVEQRKKIYTDFQRILVEDQPAHFLYYPYIYTIKRK